jgi:amino acid permease
MNEATDDLLFVCVLVAIIRGWMVLKAAADDNITAAAVRNNLVAVMLLLLYYIYDLRQKKIVVWLSA